MVRCLVENCKSKTNFKSFQQFMEETKLGKSISFFKFPSCPKMQIWWRKKLFVIETANILSEDCQICEKHFLPTDFLVYNYNEAILKETAIPKLYISSIDWAKGAKSKLASIVQCDIKDIDIDLLLSAASSTNPTSTNTDCDFKCRFCLKTKKEIILNYWRKITIPKFKEIYLQVTGSEVHITHELSKLCCIFCYNRLKEAADTMLYFRKNHLKLENYLNDLAKESIESIQINENDRKEIISSNILDHNSDNNSEMIENENNDNIEFCDSEKINENHVKEVISSETNDFDFDNYETFEDDYQNNESDDGPNEINKIEQDKSKLMRCSLCFEVFKETSIYLAHMKENHIEAESTLRCDFCSSKFSTVLRLIAHIEYYHIGQTLGCLECLRCSGRTFNSKEYYRRHMKFNHSPLPGEPIKSRQAVSVECTICKKVSKSAELLVKHMYLVHKPRTFGCDECGAMFVNPFKRKVHQMIHSDVRSFVCETCGMKFKHKDILRNHQNRVHDDVDRRRRTSSDLATLPCSICNRKYVKLKNIKRHMEQVHKEISKHEWKLLLKRSCVRCNYIFENEEYLKDHRENTCN